MDQRYQGLLDLINGGGPNRAGLTFEGGGLSGLLNSLGIRPMGYQDRLAEARPQPNPMMTAPTVSTMGAPPVADNFAYVAGRPDMAGPAPTMPNTMGGISMPGQPSLTQEQIMQLLMDLNLMPQAPMSTSPRMPMGENYDPMARGAGVFPIGYGRQ